MIWCLGNEDAVKRKEDLDEEIVPETMGGFFS
jgi:hypothetical protein